MSRLALLAVLALAACSGSSRTAMPPPIGSPLAIAAPPSGALTDAQLDRVAADIRRLEAAPLAPDADAARRVLLTWLIGSPDVSVTVCSSSARYLGGGDGSLQSALGLQSLLSEAAFRIEAEGDVGRDEGRVAGAEGMLHAYEAARAGGADVVTSYEGLLTARNAGRLDAALGSC